MNTKPELKSQSLNNKLKRFTSRLLSSYYGNPIEDMELIIITGSHHAITSKMLCGSLRASNQKVQLLIAENFLSLSMVHKFFSDAWKKGANYVIISTPEHFLNSDTFYKIPTAMILNTAPFSENLPNFINFCKIQSTFRNKQSKPNFSTQTLVFSENPDEISTLSSNLTNLTLFGAPNLTNFYLNSTKSYKQGTQVNISTPSGNLELATFSTDNHITNAMLAVTTTLISLGYNPDSFQDLFSEWEDHI